MGGSRIEAAPAASAWLGLALLLTGCAVPQDLPTEVTALLERSRGGQVPFGYLSPSEWVDGAALLPAPPARGSAAELADLEAHRALVPARATSRWTQAISDAEVLAYPQALHSFSCVVGTVISEKTTPHLNMLLLRAGVDGGMSALSVKKKYQRTRPFVELGEKSCTPNWDIVLAQDGSYPSGHAVLGWTWGALLAGLAPDRSDALLQRGADFGVSRMVCAVHWQTDVTAGQKLAAATLSRLEANEAFRRQRELARQELKLARAKGAAPEPGCTPL